MSNIYIQEPPTTGKVLLKTSAGDIDVELWTREAPKACRNFIQLCMEGYYNGTMFHRVVKGFIVQGGDPNGDGTGGESIYGEPFKDEFHTRLRFNRRGLVAMANAGKDDNGSQFFFTLGETAELQNKHTIFGKVGGDTVYNVLKMENCDIDANERPSYPYKIIKAEILLNPFDDIVPRQTTKSDRSESKSKKKRREKGVKNFGLLSFGEEAEEDEAETNQFVQKNAIKSKSVHDIGDDPSLSKKTVVIEEKDADSNENTQEKKNATESEDENAVKEKTDRIRSKLKTASKNRKEQKGETSTAKKDEAPTVKKGEQSDSDDDFYGGLERERKIKRQKEADDIRTEIKALKKSYQSERKAKEEKPQKEEKKEKDTSNELVQDYMSEQRKYTNLLKDAPKKGDEREKRTLELMKQFKSKMYQMHGDKDGQSDDSDKVEPTTDVTDVTDVTDEDLNKDDWFAHKLRCREQGEVLAKDASSKNDDWHDLYDPRNPLNKRKRGDDSRKDRHRERDRDKPHNRH